MTSLRSCWTVVMICAAAAVAAGQPCFTPHRSYGECMPVNDCKYIKDLYVRNRANLPLGFKSYLQNARCQGATPKIHICCDLSFIDYTPRTLPPTTPPPTPTTASPFAAKMQADSPRKGWRIAASAQDYLQSLDPSGVRILNGFQCGLASDGRVSYGNNTSVFEFPWMALIRYAGHSDAEFKCGGSLITDRFVLTAAHCIKGEEVVGVRLGEHNLDTERDCERRGRNEICAPPVENYGIEKIIVHPQYSRINILNDVALIKLDRRVIFKEHIKPICLPITEKSIQYDPESIRQYFIAGWGATQTQLAAQTLQKALIPEQSLDYCRRTYRREFSENHICVGGTMRVDSCNGDSGGPLFYLSSYQQTPRYVQYGVVSFGGAKCGSEKTSPGIYMNLVQQMPWITKHIQD